jgi:two-component system sensor histidine kinase GlrK
MRVATKLAIGYGLLVLLLAGVLLYHLTAVRGIQSTNQTLASLVLRLSSTAPNQLARLDELNENGSKYRISGDTGYVARFEEARARFEADLATLAALDLSPEERLLLETLSGLWPRLFPAGIGLDSLIALHTPAGGGRVGVDGEFEVWLDNATRQLRERTTAIYRASQGEVEEAVAASLGAARQAERLSLWSLGAALTLSALVFVLILRSISGPLARLRRGTQAVAGGNFEHRMELVRDDEFSELASDFNAMTKRLRELDHAKRDFLSQVSHDLKTPLAAMEDANVLLLDEIPGRLNERQRRLLEHNVNSGRRLAAMLGKLLDVSRMEAGAADYRFARCDLHGVIREAVAGFESAAERRAIMLVEELPEPSLTVECDAERVLQVISNLIENAVRYSPEGGTIRVEARAYPGSDPARGSGGAGFALVGVTDSGPGVPDSEKNRIFERFHQGTNGSAHGKGGVGLGLAICKEIVRAHGGRIWVSDAPQGGAVFSFLLPLAASARRPEPAGAAAS